jgi:hypothetical protein
VLQEHDLPPIIAQAGEVAVVGPVKILLAFARPVAGQQIALVIAIEMNFEGLARRLVTGQEFCVMFASPAAAVTNVGTQSSCETISLISVPGLMTPGQRIMPGTR